MSEFSTNMHKHKYTIHLFITAGILFSVIYKTNRYIISVFIYECNTTDTL